MEGLCFGQVSYIAWFAMIDQELLMGF